MKRYDERVLEKLLDRYENSLLYTGKNRVNVTISLPVQKSTFPEYFDETWTQYDVLHEQLGALEERGYIRLIWKNKKQGHILEKCELVVEKAGEAYLYLHRKSRWEKEQEIRKVCSRYSGRARELDIFLKWITEQLDAGQSIRKYADIGDAKAFSRLCELICKILKNEKECFLREFSVQHFHDSKFVEKEIEKAADIIVRFTDKDTLRGLSATEVLEEYNIYRNPSWLMMKGTGYFQIEKESLVSKIDLRSVSGGIGISNQDIDYIQWDLKQRPDWILTIENLTSFHQWNREPDKDKTVLCIYLGGYHNRVKREFLKRLYQVYPQSEYYHFGDIDCGGFRIWKDLCQKTEIPFQTFRMDCDTYRQYISLGRELTEADRKTLQSMLADSFFEKHKELMKMMLENGKKLEQECIKINCAGT